MRQLCADKWHERQAALAVSNVACVRVLLSHRLNVRSSEFSVLVSCTPPKEHMLIIPGRLLRLPGKPQLEALLYVLEGKVVESSKLSMTRSMLVAWH